MKQTVLEKVHAPMTGSIVTEVQECADRASWNSWLNERQGNSLFHRIEWDDVFAVYRLPVVRLCVLQNGRIVGGLPLVWQKSRLFGNQLVSLPWFDAAGILAEDKDAARALIDAARSWAESRQIDTLQIRQADEFDDALFSRKLHDNVAMRTDKLLLRLPLPDDPSELWGGFNPKVRNQIRKGEKSGLTVECGGRELLDGFYKVYARNMRDLGSPPHHRRFFESIVSAFPDESRVWIVRFQRQVVGAALTLANGNQLEVPWASSWRRYNDRCVNHLMYWKIIEDACHSGFRAFHFGRSSLDSGTYQFKKQWGAEAVPLYWYYFSRGTQPSEKVTSPQNSFHLATRVWSRLPVWLASAMGPHIISKTP